MTPGQVAKVAVSAATFAIDKPYDYRVPEELHSTLRPGMRVLVPFGGGDRAAEGIVLSVAAGEYRGRLKQVTALLDETPILDRDGIRLALWMRDRFFCTVYDAVKAMLPAGLWYDLEEQYQLAVPEEAAEEAAGASQAKRLLVDTLEKNGGTASRKAINLSFGTKNPMPALSELMRQGIVTRKTETSRRVRDKTIEVLRLSITPEEAMALSERQKRSPQRGSVLRLLAAVGRASLREVSYMTGASRAVLKAMVKSGYLLLEREETLRRPSYPVSQGKETTLNPEQEKAFLGLNALLEAGAPACALLYGVTGSGKTQVYIKLIAKALEQGRGALLLVPEIALTPQLLSLVSGVFMGQVAVLHSSLRPGERYDEWKRIRSGQARVVVGTRSAVFAPVSRLGLVILDEEQEYSYQSDQTPRYHARDVAKFRCAKEGALLLLGSATPSVETFYHAKRGEYQLFTLKDRYNNGPMPQVIVSDLRKALRAGSGGPISPPLYEALKETLEQGQQSILLINRRGDSPMVTCGECGAVPTCPNCSVHMTYHSANGRLMCHHCGHSEPLPSACPACGGKLKLVGAGTQKVQRELMALFPNVEILRMDADTVSAAGSHEKILRQFAQQRAPILVGTQMVAKGLHFENVTLVGVISADASLYMEDYRAAERTFSLLTQVVGRAGRGDVSGRAVIQTFTPENEVIACAARQDYDAFYASEIELRRMRGCPPFRDLFTLTFISPKEQKAMAAAAETKGKLERTFASQDWEALSPQVLGPAPAPIVKLHNRYRYRLIVACENREPIRRLLSHVLAAATQDKMKREVSLSIEVNGMD